MSDMRIKDTTEYPSSSDGFKRTMGCDTKNANMKFGQMHVNASQQVLASHVAAFPEHFTTLPLLTGVAPLQEVTIMSHVAFASQHMGGTCK